MLVVNACITQEFCEQSTIDLLMYEIRSPLVRKGVVHLIATFTALLVPPWCIMRESMENVMCVGYALREPGVGASFVARGWACIAILESWHLLGLLLEVRKAISKKKIFDVTWITKSRYIATFGQAMRKT